MNVIRVQELEKSVIHRIAKLSDFYYARKQRKKQSYLVGGNSEACLAPHISLQTLAGVTSVFQKYMLSREAYHTAALVIHNLQKLQLFARLHAPTSRVETKTLS